MAGNKILLLALVLCFGQRVFLRNVDITIKPKTLTLSPGTSAAAGGNITVTCTANPDASDVLTTVSVKRTIIGSSEETSVVTLVVATNNLNRNTSIPAMTVTSSSTDSERTVVVTMEKTNCEDAGNYTCKAIFVDSAGDTPTPSTFKTLDVEVTPGNISLIPDPNYQVWTEGQTLTLPCSGPVGTVVTNVTKIEWVWEYKDGNGGVWTPYQNASDIDEINPPLKRECYERWSSTLTRVLTVKDTNREYRCYIKRNTIPFLEFAATHTVGTVNPEGYTTPKPDGGGGDGGTSQPSKGNVGAIVGGVIGALVLIIIIVVVVVFLVRRKSRNENDYETDEPGSKPADNPRAAPNYPDPGAVSYSQPNRFRNSREPQGVSNKAMDEAGDKPSPYQPPRYSNDFHQGRPNKGYDYDQEAGRRSRYNSDEDGTDSRVNTSQLSLGHGDPTIGTPI